MAKKRNGRQDAIRDIVRNKDVRTQRVLVDELRAMGFDCLSRYCRYGAA